MAYENLPLGCDASHYQGAIDFPALVAGGVGFIIIKATQGSGTDPMFDANRKGAADAGLLAFAYPFLTPDDDSDAAAHFLSVADGMVAALDWEAAGVDGGVVEMWMDACEAKANRAGLAYYGLYPPDTVSERIASWPRWFPEYRDTPRLPPWDGVSAWDWSKEWLIWQFSGSGRAAGVTTQIDLNRLAVPLATLKGWHDTGTFPAP